MWIVTNRQTKGLTDWLGLQLLELLSQLEMSLLGDGGRTCATLALKPDSNGLER